MSERFPFVPGRQGVIALKLLVAVALFWWLISNGGLDLAQFADIEPGRALAAAVTLRTASLLIPVWRWCLLARGAGIDMAWMAGIQVGLVGRFFSLALPGSFGLDSARLFYGRRIDPDKSAEVLTSVLVDRAIGALSLLLLSMGLGVWGLLRSDPILSDLARLCCGLLPAAVGVFGMDRIRTYLQRVLRGMLAYRRRPAVIGWSFILSMAGHLASFVAAWCVFQAYGSAIALPVVLVLQPVVTLAWLLPVTPQGLGVADSAAHWIYLQAGSGIGAEVLLVLRAISLAVGLCCGLAYFAPIRGVRR